MYIFDYNVLPIFNQSPSEGFVHLFREVHGVDINVTG